MNVIILIMILLGGLLASCCISFFMVFVLGISPVGKDFKDDGE
jgi:hypothetical protein